MANRRSKEDTNPQHTDEGFQPDSLDSESANAGYEVMPDVPGSDADVRAARHERREDLHNRIEDVTAHDYQFVERQPAPPMKSGKKRKRNLSTADIVKLIGLLAVFALMCAITAALWPTLSQVFEEGGVERLVTKIQQAGAAGVATLLGLQLLQVIVAFIPGEVVQVAAGMMYGPWLGGLIVALGACAASAVVYLLVHWLGAPFVRNMVSDSFSEKFQRFEASGKLDTVVFILFLIPGMPKDVFTYVVALTDMRMSKFLLLTTLARLPGIFVSTYAASSLADGDITKGAVIFIIAAVIAIVCIVLRGRIINRLDGFKKRQ
jgi:uncharacterized membrane protein YdjX (TVP38/TMEM64 family)